MTVTLTYDDQLSRVRVTATALDAAAVTARVDRSTNGIRWTDVRGALQLAVAGGVLQLPADDYEFPADQLVTYRLRTYDVAGVELANETATITPALTVPWLKVIARPFLNRPVTVQDYSDVERRHRAGVFDVVGRTMPVVVSDVRSSRELDLVLLTSTPEQARELDLVLLSGEPVFLQIPEGFDVPAGYFHVGDTKQSRPSRKSVRRLFALPLTEVDAPGPDIVGATSTWHTVTDTYSTWSDVLAAHSSWANLLELIGDPSEVIVQ